MKDLIDRYPRQVIWSEEDGCFVGRCPDLFLGGCHGENKEEVDVELRGIIASTIADYKKEGRPLPPPSLRSARLSEALLARRKAKLSQSRFASLIGVAPATLRNWEQGRVKPKGTAATLLRIIENHPEVLRELARAEAVGSA